MRGFSPADLQQTLTRRAFVAGTIATTASLALYGNGYARRDLEIVEQTFHIAGLPPAFDGFRIVQFSDIHLEQYTEDFFLLDVIAQVNALAADLVLVTGDFVSRGPLAVQMSYDAAARCAILLRGLTCPQRYGIVGNHDAIVGSRIVRDHMENNGLPFLVNQFVHIERGGQRIILSGLDTCSFGYPNLSLALPPKPDAPVILMVHEPDFAVRVVNHRLGPSVDLILAGHTHGGQVRIPGLRPMSLPPFGKLYPEGRFQLGRCQLYVNRGIGTVGIPFRFNCRPEITVATLKPRIRD